MCRSQLNRRWFSYWFYQEVFVEKTIRSLERRNGGSLLLGSYYTYFSDFWWIVLFISITTLPILLYVLFYKKCIVLLF